MSAQIYATKANGPVSSAPNSPTFKLVSIDKLCILKLYRTFKEHVCTVTDCSLSSTPFRPVTNSVVSPQITWAKQSKWTHTIPAQEMCAVVGLHHIPGSSQSVCLTFGHKESKFHINFIVVKDFLTLSVSSPRYFGYISPFTAISKIWL